MVTVPEVVATDSAAAVGYPLVMPPPSIYVDPPVLGVQRPMLLP